MTSLIGMLMFGTLGFVAVFAYINARTTRRLKGTMPQSTLSRDSEHWELARAKNAEWLPDGVSQRWHQEQRAPYEEVGTLVGTLKPGHCDPELVQLVQPASGSHVS